MPDPGHGFAFPKTVAMQILGGIANRAVRTLRDFCTDPESVQVYGASLLELDHLEFHRER